MFSSFGKHTVSRVLKCAFYTSLRNSSTLKEKTIGVVGLGHVGQAVCNNLLRHGYNLASIYDKDVDKMAQYASVKKASNSREVAEECEIIVTALPMPPHIRACAEGDEGLLAGLSEGKVWVDHSTTDYEDTKEFSKKVSSIGAHLLEAPITGGLEALAKGEMSVFLAGEKEVAEKIRPILECSYHNVLYTGELGSALIPKVYSNILCAVNLIAVGEVLMIAKKAGLDLPTFWHAIRASSGNSFVWETAVPGIFRGDYDPTFSIALHCKDYQLGYDIAKKHKVPIEMLALGQQIYNRARYTYGEEAPCYIIPKLTEDGLKESLQVPGFADWKYSIDNVDGSAVIRHHNIELKDNKTSIIEAIKKQQQSDEGCTEGSTDGSTDGSIKGSTEGSTESSTDTITDIRTDIFVTRTDGTTKGRTEGKTDGRTDRRTDGRTNGRNDGSNDGRDLDW